MADIQRVKAALRCSYHCFKYYKTGPDDLITALESNLKHISKTSWPERFDWGGIYVNGLLQTKNCQLKFPCKIEYYQPKTSIEESKASYPSFDSKWIIYEDQYICACFKPCNLSSHIAKEQRHISLYSYLSEYLNTDIHMPSRLDFSTAGLMLVSKCRDCHDLIQKLFEERKIKKNYLLKVNKTFDWKQKTIDLAIGRDQSHFVLRKPDRKNGKPALTEFEVIAEENNSSLLKAKPITGRTHQIRVHSSYGLGSPIVGDHFYNGQEAESLNLLSYSYEFIHPIEKNLLSIKLDRALCPEWVKPELPP